MKFSEFSWGLDWKELRKFEKLDESKSMIVFYAENKASMNHFKTLIFELTEKMNLEICYVTSVKDDPMLTSQNLKIQSFYIGDGTARTKFFLTLKARILIMDMPDLEKFHIKRSKAMFSVHSYLREGAIDNYDTIFCVGEHHKNEIRETEKVYKLKPKKLIEYGFGRLDTLLVQNEKFQKIDKKSNELIIISPSYGKNNLLELCGIELLDILLNSNFKILLRPHFKTLKESKKLINTILEKFGDNPNFTLEEGIIPPEKFHKSKCMISDWSGISLEYAFTFERPVVFIDVPKKVLNPNSADISLEPIEISIREKIGYVISPTNLVKIPNIIKKINEDKSLNNQIEKIRSETVYHIGNSAEIGSKYIQELIS